MMEEPGQKLKRVRERLNLRFREVEEASTEIAQRRGNDEFIVALSRLADIENKGTIPSIYRLYSLCAIYRLDLSEVLGWYGISLGMIPPTPRSNMSARTSSDSGPKKAMFRFPSRSIPGWISHALHF
jgi:transcriptional regulator with XRE-family HTH domain